MTGDSRKPASGRPARALPALYPIIDIDLCVHRGLDPLAVARACLAGGAQLLQVRQKGTGGGSGACLAVIRAVVAAARPAGAAVIVNDRADLALLAGADGVHVGQQDLSPETVRALVGPGPVIGISTHTPEQVEAAIAGPADYVAVGPVFSTATKDTGYGPRGLALVTLAAAGGKPVVAIGGVTAANARSVLDAGAASVAIISDLLNADDPAAYVRDALVRLGR